MQTPPRVIFRNMDPSEFIEAEVREKISKLEEFFDRIVRCQVSIDMPHHHRKGNVFQVRIDLTVPGRELVVNRESVLDHAHEDLHVAIRDAFDKARRQLEDYARELRADVKHHAGLPHGRIAKLLENSGFIAAPDGEEIFFHRNSLVDCNFEELEIGHEVRYALEPEHEGPRASTVHLVGRACPA